MTVKILLTGGTIEKEYDKIHGELVLTKTHIDQMMEQARCRLEVSMVETRLLKDSLQMDDQDRQHITDKCISFSEDKVVIIHGTDTMVETAAVLAEKIKIKTIVLFGAMIPYSFGNSDALFNFGTALAAVQALPKGVYITMNGIIFPYDKVIKNKQEGYFMQNYPPDNP
jgi:L-asparaginase